MIEDKMHLVALIVVVVVAVIVYLYFCFSFSFWQIYRQTYGSRCRLAQIHIVIKSVCFGYIKTNIVINKPIAKCRIQMYAGVCVCVYRYVYILYYVSLCIFCKNVLFSSCFFIFVFVFHELKMKETCCTIFQIYI